MKILIVAYACDPYRGSEPGVGWAAVCRIAQKHDVWVLADVHNREGWERAAKDGIIPSNVQVRFLRKIKNHLENRFLARFQDWFRYADFNRKVLKAAQTWHDEVQFDLCHQVTIAAWRMPTPLWQLPIPLIWGPIGGAGWMPYSFRSMLSPKSRLFEIIRDCNTWLIQRGHAFRDCIRQASVVIAANEETEEFLTPHRGERHMVRLPIVSLSPEKIEQFRRPASSIRHATRELGPLKLFAGGNMEGRKGVSLALRALAIVASRGVDFHYTIAGGGPEVGTLELLSYKLGIQHKVEFHPGYVGEHYIAALQQADVYFLPSFRESTPVTLMESYLAGCYPVVADASAQGEITRLAGGIAVKADNQDDMVQGLADAICWCAEHREQLPSLAAESVSKVNAYFSSERYDRILDEAYTYAIQNYQRH